jgi:lipopolysaccharide transport system ATP-binding protein
MSELVIRAEGLGKQYRLGGLRRNYRTLRETITQATAGRFRAARRRRATAPVSQPSGFFWALRDIDFTINQGEVVGIIGRNGAGKSTLLKILSRITEPSEGYVEIAGRVGSLLEVGTGFHPELSGRENIFLNAAILGMGRAEIGRKFEQIVEFAEVQKFIDTPVKHYSTGMYLRLAFSVAAHLEPDILLVDEVLAVGDIAFQRKCMGRMGKVADEGRTVLFVSHNMGAIRSLCRRGIFLQDGRIIENGPIARSIEAYYKAIGILENNGEGSENHDARAGFGPIRINNAPGNSVVQSEGFELSTTLRFDHVVSGFSFYCFIDDMQGRSIVMLPEKSSTLGLRDVAPGSYQFSVMFPPLWLSPGLYSAYFKVVFWQQCDASPQFVSDTFPLDVTGDSPADESPNVPMLHPRVSWDVTKENCCATPMAPVSTIEP